MVSKTEMLRRFAILMLALVSVCAYTESQQDSADGTLTLIDAGGGTLLWHASNHESSQVLNNGETSFRQQINNGEEQYTTANYHPADSSLVLKYQNSWHSALFYEPVGQPVDLSPFVSGGVLNLEMRVDEVQRSNLDIGVGCGPQCETKVRLREWALQHDGQGWQALSFSMRCFAQDGADFKAVARPFMLEAGGKGSVAIRNIRFSTTGNGSFPCPDLASLAITPDILNEYWSEDWWLPRHQEKLQQAANQQVDLLLIGDSITHGWENTGKDVWGKWFGDVATLNLGFSGDRTENVLWRLQHGEVDAINPKLAMVMIGTNNTGHRMDRPQYIAQGVRKILDELKTRLPATRVLLLKIFPRSENASDIQRQNNEATNALLADLAAEYQVLFADFNTAFLDEDDRLSRDIMPDLLHPNVAGYEIWARQLAPYVDRYVRRPGQDGSVPLTESEASSTN